MMLMLFLEQGRGRPTWPLGAIWCPRAQRWRPVLSITATKEEIMFDFVKYVVCFQTKDCQLLRNLEKKF